MIVKSFFTVICILASTTAIAGVLLQPSSLEYVGAFRVPKGNLGGDSTNDHTLSGAGSGLTYNPVNNTLILATRSSEKHAIEISIPSTIVNTTSTGTNISNITTAIQTLTSATVVQTPINVASNQWNNLGPNYEAVPLGAGPAGFLVANGKLIGSAMAGYDAAYLAYRSHFSAALDWTASGSQFSGFKMVGTSPTGSGPNGGYVGGYMAHVPPEWQTAIGAPVLTGAGPVSIISRASAGPGAWGFDPSVIGSQDPVPATMIVGYTQDHLTLGVGDTGLIYNQVTQVNGAVFPQGSDSVIFFGRHGLGITGQGDTCYGTGTNDIAKHGIVPVGNTFPECYDLAFSDEGTHGYPYRYFMWFYSASDLAAVKAGTKNPWEPVPYATQEITLPYQFPTEKNQISGVAYDPSTQRIYIAQDAVDKIYNEYEWYPIIQVFNVGLSPVQSGKRYRYLSISND